MNYHKMTLKGIKLEPLSSKLLRKCHLKAIEAGAKEEQ